MLTVHQGHALPLLQQHLAADSVHCVVTSPPYNGLRDYGTAPVAWPEVVYSPMPGLPQITIPAMTCSLGLESTLETFIGHLVLIFREVRRVLHPTGTCWVNMGDGYASDAGGYNENGSRGSISSKRLSSGTMKAVLRSGTRRPMEGLKHKDLQGQPWRLAFALQADGWYLRTDVIWHKPNPMPESTQDRPTKSHEYLFLLTKSRRYFYDAAAISEPCSENTHERIARVKEGSGSTRANGGTRPVKPMTAVVARSTAASQFPSAALRDDAQGRRRKAACSATSTVKGTPHGRHALGAALPPAERRKLAAPSSGIKSNTSMDAALAVMPLRRNKRTVWSIPTQGFKGAHFATFPEDLARPCILAGSSSAGVCPHCLAPWARGRIKTGHVNGRKPSPQSPGRPELTQTSSTGWQPVTAAGSIWQPTCRCADHRPVPATVLDPFLGSGTTAAVALQEGRHAIGLELSADYLAIARKRLALVNPAFSLPIEHATPPPKKTLPRPRPPSLHIPTHQQASLFP